MCVSQSALLRRAATGGGRGCVMSTLLCFVLFAEESPNFDVVAGVCARCAARAPHAEKIRLKNTSITLHLVLL